MRAFVTGGTGFLGGHIVEHLVSAGFEVVALARRADDRERLPQGARLHLGDVTDIASLESGMEGCGAVFHAAALVKRWARDPREFDRVNIEGLGNVLRAASRAGVRKVLYTSSFIALGPTDGTVADEDFEPGPRILHNDYERTKWAADRFARVKQREGEPLVVLYPGVIYGEGRLTDGNIIAQAVQKHLEGKLPGTIGPGDRRQCFTYVKDAAAGHVLAFQKAEFGSRYILGGENRTVRDLFAFVEKASGVPAPRRKIPYGIAGMVGLAQRLRAYVTGKEPEITDQEVGIYRHEWAYSSERAVRDLGYRMTPLEVGVARMVAWLRPGAPARAVGA
jgi:farnesol dehydrogenase